MSSLRDRRWWFEDFPAGSVREFGSVTLSREDILAFARQYDPQPFHVDEEAARHTHFGGLVASGWQTSALTTKMACDAFLLDTAAIGSPGIENIRFLKPVRPGDTLRVRLTTTEARPMRSKRHVGLVKQAFTLLNQHGVEVLTMEAYTMMLRRDPR